MTRTPARSPCVRSTAMPHTLRGLILSITSRQSSISPLVVRPTIHLPPLSLRVWQPVDGQRLPSRFKPHTNQTVLPQCHHSAMSPSLNIDSAQSLPLKHLTLPTFPRRRNFQPPLLSRRHSHWARSIWARSIGAQSVLLLQCLILQLPRSQVTDSLHAIPRMRGHQVQ
jgi:hypothetical protein